MDSHTESTADNSTWKPEGFLGWMKASKAMTTEPTNRGRAYGEGFEAGMRAVSRLRCMEHRAVPPYNATVDGGAECAACEVERLRALLEVVKMHIDELASAWERGAISEHDGGTRTNRNWDVAILLESALREKP